MASEEEKREAIFEALHLSLVSLDESDEEDPTSMVTRPLTWRTEVINFFHVLDQRYMSSMTNQQKRQSVKRRLGYCGRWDHNRRRWTS